MNEKRILMIGLVIIIALLSVSGFALVKYYTNTDTVSQANYQKALEVQNPENICAIPSGYTDESWKEHMGHHPDVYAQCLSNQSG